MPTTLSCVILLTYKLCISQFISFIIKDIWVSTKFKCFSGLCGEVVVDDSVCNDLKPFFSLNWLKCYTNITWKTVVCFFGLRKKDLYLVMMQKLIFLVYAVRIPQ